MKNQLEQNIKARSIFTIKKTLFMFMADDISSKDSFSHFHGLQNSGVEESSLSCSVMVSVGNIWCQIK